MAALHVVAVLERLAQPLLLLGLELACARMGSTCCAAADAVAVVVAAAVTRRSARWRAVRCAVFTALTLLHRLDAAGIACCWRLHHQLYEQPVEQKGAGESITMHAAKKEPNCSSCLQLLLLHAT